MSVAEPRVPSQRRNQMSRLRGCLVEPQRREPRRGKAPEQSLCVFRVSAVALSPFCASDAPDPPAQRNHQSVRIKPQRREGRRGFGQRTLSAFLRFPLPLFLGCWRSPSATQDNAPDGVAEVHGVEVDQQPQCPATQPELTQKLCFVDRQHFEQRTWRNYYRLSDEQLDFVVPWQHMPFVSQREGFLALERDASQVQFMTQTQFVRGRQQTGAK